MCGQSAHHGERVNLLDDAVQSTIHQPNPLLEESTQEKRVPVALEERLALKQRRNNGHLQRHVEYNLQEHCTTHPELDTASLVDSTFDALCRH